MGTTDSPDVASDDLAPDDPTARDDGAARTSDAAPADEAGAPRRRRVNGRVAASVLCGFLAVLLVLTGISGLWIMRTAANEEWTERAIAQTLRDPQVSDSLAATMIDEFDSAVDLNARITEILPAPADKAAPILLAAARNLMQQRLSEVIRSDAVVNVAAKAVGTAQQKAVAVLSGDGTIEGVDVETGEVRVNLLPLIPVVIAAGQNVGLFSKVTVPDLNGLSRDEQLTAVSTALDRPLKDTFAQPVVFKSEAVTKAGNTLNTVRLVLLWARRLFWLLLIAGAAFAAGAIYLARNRARGTLWLGGGFLVAFLLVRGTVARAAAQLPQITPNLGGQAAISQVTNGAVNTLTGWFIWFGIIIASALGAVWWLTRRSGSTAGSTTGSTASPTTGS